MPDFIGTIHRSADPTSGIRRGRGAPRGNRNAFKHGRYSKEVQDLMKSVAAWNRETRALLASAKATSGEKKRPIRTFVATRYDRD